MNATQERKQELGLLVFLGVALTVLFPYFEQTRNANEVPRLLQAMAIVDAGQWAIDGPASRGLDPGPDVARSQRDGRLYPNKPPGMSVVGAGGYVVARAMSAADDPLTLRRFTLWTRLLGGAAPTLLVGWFFFRRSRATHGRRLAMGAVVLFVLGTPAQSYAHLAYGHALTAALVAVGVSVLVRAVVLEPRSARSPAWAFVGGAMAGAAVVVEYAAVFAAIPLGVMLLWRARSPRVLGLASMATLGALTSVAMLALYHRAVYGSVWQTGYHHVIDPGFAHKHGQGLLGLGLPRFEALHTHLFAADTGLLWWAPLVLLGLYGLVRLAAHAEPGVRVEARVHLGLWLVYVLVVSSLSFEGGWRVGPRYLVLVLPSLVLGWTEALSQVRTQPAWIVTVVALGTYSIVVNTLAANFWPHFDPTNIHHPVSEVLLPLWAGDLAPYGITEAVWGATTTKAVVLAIVAIACFVLARCVEAKPSNLVALTIGVSMGLGLVAATRAWPEHPAGVRNLAYIERIWEPRPGSDTASPSVVLRPLETTRGDARGRASPSR
jgi:hypothetical protein